MDRVRTLMALACGLGMALVVGCGDDDTEGTPPSGDAGTDVQADAAGDAAEVDADTSESDVGDPDIADDAPDDADAAPGPLLCVVADGVGEPVVVTIAGWTVTADPADGSWEVVPPHGGPAVLAGPAGCRELEDGGTQPSVSVGIGNPFATHLAGSFLIDLDEDVSWIPVATSSPQVVASDGGLGLTWSLAGDQGTVSLLFASYGTSDLMIRLSTDHPDASMGSLSFASDEGEDFFGLGTQATGMELSGRRYPLWTQEQGIGKPEGGGVPGLNNIPEAAYAPMGVWHSSKGYSALVGHDAYSELDLRETSVDRVALRSNKEMPSLVLVSGDTPRARLASVTEYLGRPTEPADWVFGPWNDSVGGPDVLARVSALLRDNHIPSSAIWSEDWAGSTPMNEGFRLTYAWEWDSGTYPDLPADIASLHDRGFAFLGYFNPFVPSTTLMWQQGIDGDYLLYDEAGELVHFRDPGQRDASMVDLTNDEAHAWLDGYLRFAADDLGIDGWMADFAEWLPAETVLANGQTGWLVHNRYPLLWQAANRSALEGVHANGDEPANNWVFFARSGWASVNGGSAGLAPAMWGGDQDTDWDSDDGLPTVVPIAVHAGLAGVSIFGTDIAGYSSFFAPNTGKELFYRWSTLGAFHPLMRTHHGSDECGNWQFDRDDETLEHFKRYAIVHTLMLPVFQSLSGESVAAGLPIMRHPWLVEPSRRGLYTDVDAEFFLGDDILVAPVMVEGATARRVHLPEAGWWPLFGDAPVAGEAADGDVVWVEAQAAATEIPVFVRPGALLPLLMEPVDSHYGASAAGVTDLDDVSGRYRAALYPDAEGEVGAAAVGALAVSATGLSGVDWAVARLAGEAQPLEVCADEPQATCRLVDGSGVLVFGGDVIVEAGGAQLTFVGDAPEQVTLVAVGGAAWGPWRQPTTLTDLDPQVPPPCEQ